MLGSNINPASTVISEKHGSTPGGKKLDGRRKLVVAGASQPRLSCRENKIKAKQRRSQGRLPVTNLEVKSRHCVIYSRFEDGGENTGSRIRALRGA